MAWRAGGAGQSGTSCRWVAAAPLHRPSSRRQCPAEGRPAGEWPPQQGWFAGGEQRSQGLHEGRIPEQGTAKIRSIRMMAIFAG